MGSTMQNLIEKRNNPDYLNYIAVGEALRVLGGGLRHYAEQEARAMHAKLLKKLAGTQCNCLCTPGVKPCHHTCQWAKELEKLHSNKKKRRIPFYQSDCTLWHDPNNGYWEVAKIFMSDLGAKWHDVKDPATTDLTGLLNFLIFCKHVNVPKRLLEPVRDLRNDWAHSPHLMFSESQKQAAFLAIDNLMNDVELLKCKDVQDCHPGIEGAKNADVSFVQEKDLLVLQELTRYQEFEKERRAENDREELKEKMIELILLSNTNYQANTYPSDNHLKDDVMCVFILLIKLLFLIFVDVFSKLSRHLSWLLLVVLLISYVGDDSDDGCPRIVTDETASFRQFGFHEFDFTAHLSYKRENFFGRNWFFRELDDIFESSYAPAGILVTGDPGSGKSALMSQLICSPFSSLAISDNIIGYHICDYSEPGTRDGSSFVRNLVDQIASNIPEYAYRMVKEKELRTHLDKRCERDPTACFRTTIIRPLMELTNIDPDNFKYILIDALDECVEMDGETSTILDILHYRISHFPPWLKLIMSSRNGTAVTSKVPRTVRRMSINPEDERNVEDIRSYVARYLREKSSFLNKLLKAVSQVQDMSHEITNELTKRAEGNFLFVKTVLKNNLETDGTINLNSLPNSLDDMYYQVFQRYFVKKDFHRYAIIFEILLASSSLHETEVFGILKRQNQGEGMHDLVEHVSSLLHFRQDGTVTIYHQSFAEWLMNNQNRVKGFSIYKRRGHEYIANFLVDRISNRSITFNELSRLCMHVLYSGGPSDHHKKHLKLLNVTNIRNLQNGKCILHELARRENGSRLLEIFLSSFASVTIPDLEGKTPAFYAASEGYVESLKLFLEKGICANCILNSVSSLDEIKAVIQMKGYEELSIMHVATYNGYADVIDTLLKHNASFVKFNENVPTLLHIASERGHLDLVKLLYYYGAEVDLISLHHAAARNNFFVVKYLLETDRVRDECLQSKSVKVIELHSNKSLHEIHNMFRETALHAAVSKHHINITKLLLQFGNSALECKHHSGKTPLMDAAERNDTEMVELLLKNGANVEEKCGDETPLHFGEPQTSSVRSFHGKRFLYTIYREKTSCTCGNKALHLCAKYGLWHMAKYLITNWNASVLDKNCNGETVWKIANVSHNEDFIYHVNRMLLSLDDKSVSTQLGISKYQRRFRKLLRKFFMRTRPYQSSFQCDSTFEGMSPLHIAALMGKDVLKSVYEKVHEIAPSLPLNCTNKHWFVPRYLAYFYDSIHALSRSKRTSRSTNEHKKIMLQYPDREAEFHMIYNYFYHSPTEETNVLTYQSLTRLEDYDVTNCPGFYDLLPERKSLTAKPYCYKLPSKEKDDNEYHDPGQSALQKMEFCKGKHPTFCICFYEIEQRMMFEQYAKDCFCPVVMNELQRWFTSRPKRNRRINQFIAERMGWENSPNSDYIERWPVYFLYKKLKNEYKSYKYLEILNEGYKIDDEIDDDDDD